MALAKEVTVYVFPRVLEPGIVAVILATCPLFCIRFAVTEPSVRKHGKAGKLFPLRNVKEFVTTQVLTAVQIEFPTGDSQIHSGPLSS